MEESINVAHSARSFPQRTPIECFFQANDEEILVSCDSLDPGYRWSSHFRNVIDGHHTLEMAAMSLRIHL
jgi:hypothetical protein